MSQTFDPAPPASLLRDALCAHAAVVLQTTAQQWGMATQPRRGAGATSTPRRAWGMAGCGVQLGWQGARHGHG